MNKEVLKNIFTKKILNPFIPRYEKALYYEPGEKFTFDVRYVTGGHLSGGRTTIYFSLTTPKNLKYINSVKVKNIVVNIRDKDGYLYNENNPSSSKHNLEDFSNIEASIATDNSIWIRLIKTNGFHKNATTNADNNTVISVEIYSIELEFSDALSDEPNIEEPDIFD